MEYSINEVAKLAGVTTKTLRYYDKIGLLKPARVNDNGYRIYTKKEIDKLYKILIHKELGLKLTNIDKLFSGLTTFDVDFLENHHSELIELRNEIDKQINFTEYKINESKTLNFIFSHLMAQLIEDCKSINKAETLDSPNPNIPPESIQPYIDNMIESLNKFPYLKGSMTTFLFDKLFRNVTIDKFNEFSAQYSTFLENCSYCVENKSTDSKEAMDLCKMHIDLIKMAGYDNSKKSVLSICEKYVNNIEYFVNLSSYNDRIPQFLLDATKIYYEKGYE